MGTTETVTARRGPVLADDRYDRELLGHVHPPDWTNPEPRDPYDLVVVGGGSGGLVASAIAAAVGARVALVERSLLGGDCLNSGCVPSKALVRAGRAWKEAQEAAREFGGPEVEGDGDFARAMERLRRVRAGIAPHDSAQRFQDLGVDVYLGEAVFTGRNRVEVSERTLRFRKAVVATGGRPAIPPVPGLEESGYLTTETVFQLTERPRRLVVLGAGPVGCELAQALARLGSRVTVVEALPRVLSREDPEAADVVARALEADGVTLRLGTRAASVERDGEEIRVRLEEEDGGGEAVAPEDLTVTCDAILVATGRTPNVEGLGLDAAGVTYSGAGVAVDDRLRTSNHRIYAVGDVTGGAPFTHASDAQARLAVPNALFFGRGKASALEIPRCTYTSPEVAAVGEPAVARGGGEDDTVTVTMGEVDRARLEGDGEGFLRVHLKPGTDRIVGATAVGEGAGDLLAPLLVAMKNGVGLGKVSGTILPYPTRAEVVRKAADQWRRRKLTPRTRSVMASVLRLLRR